MLAILYVTSVASSFFAPIFDERDEEKNALTSASIAIVTGFLYALFMIHKISANIFEPYFGAVFGLLSLVFLDFGFLSDDNENCINYLMSAILGSAVLCFLCSNIHFTDYTMICHENHDYSERVTIVTTVDGTESGESIYGDGRTVGIMRKPGYSSLIYQYKYMNKNGEISTKNIFKSRTQITYIEADEEPYVEIL